MKIGIVVYSGDPETVWNAFRFGNFALKEHNKVKVFLLGKGVESESLDTEKFNVTELMRSFAGKGGEIFACGTCLNLRLSKGSKLCPLATIADLYKIIEESDKVLTF
ncbi:MAG: DsrE family protein [Candidatus Schekmanbacteria bacterium]|nr:DsrE family protein [Candidatus Schekmanbacteria bacterium]